MCPSAYLSAQPLRNLEHMQLTNPNLTEIVDSCIDEPHQISLSRLDSHLKALSTPLSIHIHAVEKNIVR